jgi:hypothetical protein
MAKTKETTVFYGLLYIDDQTTAHANIRGGGDPLDIYLRCASLCASSIAYCGYNFRLVTNERRRIENRMRQLGLAQVDVIEKKFTLSVPQNLKYRTAHFKLELYKFLGSGSFGVHVGVVDIDTVMTNPINLPALTPDTIVAYDITDQVIGEFGRDKIRFDLERVSGSQFLEFRWFGGEFLCGHAESFQRLAKSIFRLWPKYIQHVNELNHVGDEMLLAAALSDTNLVVRDAGQLGIVARWWTARTNFRQLPFKAIMGRSILHLPADKRFLAASACAPFYPPTFLRRFRRVARGKLFRRRLVNVAEQLVGRKGKYVAHLS